MPSWDSFKRSATASPNSRLASLNAHDQHIHTGPREQVHLLWINNKTPRIVFVVRKEVELVDLQLGGRVPIAVTFLNDVEDHSARSRVLLQLGVGHRGV